MKNRNKMYINIHYDGARTGVISYESPIGSRSGLVWHIGSWLLLFGAWLMFGRRKEWKSKVESL